MLATATVDADPAKCPDGLALLIDPATKKREDFTNPCSVESCIAVPTFHREEPAIALPAAVVGAATLSKMALKGDPDGYRLAYESGMGAVEAQATVLREVRDRAGSVLSVAIAAAGFAVGLALTVDPPSRMGTIGLLGAGTAALGLSGVVLAAVLIWRPSEGRFLHDAGLIVGSYVEHDPPWELPEIHRQLALWLGKQTRLNADMIRTKLKTFTWELASLLLEMVGVIVAVGDIVRG